MLNNILTKHIYTVQRRIRKDMHNPKDQNNNFPSNVPVQIMIS